MKKYNTIIYLLFILLVMGTFASMAQNSYGMKIMGGVAFSFALVFIAELFSAVRSKGKKELFSVIEPACLFILAFIFGLRVFYIYFPNVELLFAAAAVLLAMVYVQKMIRHYQKIRPANSSLAILVIGYHISIVLFLFSLALVPYMPGIAQGLGVGSFLLLLLFVMTGFIKKEFLVEGEKIALFSIVLQFKDRSVVIGSLILLFSFYIGFNRIGVLPGIYSDEFPKAYFELVEKATSKNEKPEDGKYKYEEFIKQYEQFLKRNETIGQ